MKTDYDGNIKAILDVNQRRAERERKKNTRSIYICIHGTCDEYKFEGRRCF